MKYFLVVLALFASNAFATSLLPTPNINTLGQTQGQAQGQLQGQGQAQAQMTSVDVSNRISQETRAAASSFAAGGIGVSGASSGGSTSNVDFNITTPKNTPAVFSGNVYPTAPCMGSSTVGGAGVGFGFSVGSSWTDDECGIRETSRSFSGLGKPDDALKVLCTSKYAAAAPSCATTQGEVK